MEDENSQRVNNALLNATYTHGADNTVELYRTWAKTYDQVITAMMTSRYGHAYGITGPL